jgi:hypothetical protein
MATEKRGVGIHADYKEQAKKGCDVLFCVKIKGRATLVDDIPLHMSLKIFGNPKEFDLDEMKEYVKEHDICTPDLKDLKFTPIIFTAEVSKLDYYMLKIEGLPPKYKEFYEHYKHVGNVYKNFMTHVTIDKLLYEDLKENGVEASDIEFGPLVLEHGANNPVHTFEKSENLADVLGQVIGLKEIKIQHSGEYAYGKHKLMPCDIRDTIRMDQELMCKYEKAIGLRGDDMRRYMEDNSELADAIVESNRRRADAIAKITNRK